MTPQRAVDWMAERGHFSYRNRIGDLKYMRAVAQSKNDLTLIAIFDEQIRQIEQEAFDRYDDWASDPLP